MIGFGSEGVEPLNVRFLGSESDLGHSELYIKYDIVTFMLWDCGLVSGLLICTAAASNF